MKKQFNIDQLGHTPPAPTRALPPGWREAICASLTVAVQECCFVSFLNIYIYRYINHVNSNYIQIIYIYNIYINILYILCIVLCIEDYRRMTRMTYGFLPRPERPLMVPRHSPPLHRQRLRPCHLTKSNTKTWQKRYNVSTKLNSDIFLKHLETLWIILRCEEISVDKQKHVETCWNCLLLSLMHDESAACRRRLPVSGLFRSKFSLSPAPMPDSECRFTQSLSGRNFNSPV